MALGSIRLHTAPWVVPVCGPVIIDGGVVLGDGKIIAVDTRQRLQQHYPHAEVIAHPSSALTPALVNGHIHLELSHLAELAAVPFTGSFTNWISRLLQLRDRLGAVGEQVAQVAQQVAKQLYDSGVSVLADIGNTPIGHTLAASFPGMLFPFKEYLGLAEFTLAKNSLRLQQESDTVRCSGHAPYSTHPRLLQQLKSRAASLGHVFPIHTAEPAAEREMIAHGRGELVDFVRERGFWDGSFVPLHSEKSGSIHYLHQLKLLDPRTLCIHAVHVNAEEIRIVAGEGAKVCLCPGSNQYLHIGKAPVQRYLENGILPALGTDSLASNPELSLWREMQILAKEHPEVDPATIFAMATQGGAEALGEGNRFGTLEFGKNADLLAIAMPSPTMTAAQVYNHLVTFGSAMAPLRIQG
jgi:cytosine/adenosine deaminase-related metal-dependent hydrolase